MYVYMYLSDMHFFTTNIVANGRLINWSESHTHTYTYIYIYICTDNINVDVPGWWSVLTLRPKGSHSPGGDGQKD